MNKPKGLVISLELYDLMSDLICDDTKEEKDRRIGAILKAVVDYFVKGKEPIFKYDADLKFFNHLVNYAIEKEDAWYRRHKNFIENNPKKKQQ